MALITENGWRQCSAAETVRAVVPGTRDVRIEIRAGDAATILNAWAAWWHKNVYPIDTYKPRDYWGWSATNSVWNSNHLSGTAIDLNATTLPWQQRTMSAEKIATVNYGLKLFEGCIFWGGHWQRVDEMHSQLAYPEGDARIAAFAKKLSNGYLGIYGTPKETPVTTPAPDKLASLVDGSLHTRDQYLLYIDRYMWRINKMLTAQNQRDGLPHTDAALKQVKG